MVSFIFDASAVIRYIDGEAGTERVAEILAEHQSGDGEALISSMHWGEVMGIFFKRYGLYEADAYVAKLRALQLTIVPVTVERAERCARIKAEHGIPYVDSLAVELATDTPNSVLVTADFDMKPAELFVKIEFLPTKHKH